MIWCLDLWGNLPDRSLRIALWFQEDPSLFVSKAGAEFSTLIFEEQLCDRTAFEVFGLVHTEFSPSTQRHGRKSLRRKTHGKSCFRMFSVLFHIRQAGFILLLCGRLQAV